jgi:hypothetical protein
LLSQIRSLYPHHSYQDSPPPYTRSCLLLQSVSETRLPLAARRGKEIEYLAGRASLSLLHQRSVLVAVVDNILFLSTSGSGNPCTFTSTSPLPSLRKLQLLPLIIGFQGLLHWIIIQSYGKAYQESLGTTDNINSRSLYVSNISSSHPSLTSSTDQVLAAIQGFFWPKIFWDFLTKNLDGAVKPIPVLQIVNLVLGLVILAWEWPLGFIARTAIHRSIEARLVVIPVAALAAALLYQATNPAIYYIIGMVVYFWAYSEGEVWLSCCSFALTPFPVFLLK